MFYDIYSDGQSDTYNVLTLGGFCSTTKVTQIQRRTYHVEIVTNYLYDTVTISLYRTSVHKMKEAAK